MDQIISFISGKLGISESVARESVKVLLQFAQKQTAGTDLEKLIAQIPGAAELIAEPPSAGAAAAPNPLGGLLGGFLGGDAAKAISGLQAAGLDFTQVAPFLKAFVEKSREVAGPETVDEVLKKIPALQTFLKS
ncbi:MAG TPA: hypothetical protein PLS03_03035 [Terrimicrobiaceae bacterium]|nr:hypothetical protein [Terrimicrobiaceae bacterium]